MARPHDGTTTRNDDTDVFAQLSHLLESNYLYDTSVDQFPSSSTSIRSATALGPRAENTRSSRNNFSTSSSPNDEDRISSSGNISMTKKRNDAILNPANDSSHHTPNSSISFHAWRSKVHRNKDANSGSLKSTSASTHNGAKKVGPESSSHSVQSDPARWTSFLERVNQKEKEKRRSIKSEQRRLDAVEVEECFFSPNLTTKSLKMAASFEQLRDRIPRLLTAREEYLDQQRLLLVQREAVECTFTPTRISSERSGRYLQNSSNSLMSPENYKPLVAERRRKDELLRCQIAQRDAVELTFQPKINARKSRVAISNRRTSATERQRADSANKSTRVDVQSEHSVSAVEGLAGPNPTQLENDDLHPNEIGGKEGDGCHERLYQLGLNRLSRLDEVHQNAYNRDPLVISTVSSTPHATCERLYRDGLMKLGATMPTTEANINAVYKAPPSPPSRPPPFAPSAVNSQHPFPPRSRSQSRSRCESGTLSSSERQGDNGRNCEENCARGVEDEGEGEEVELEVEIDNEEDTEDSDSDDSDDLDHSHLDDYVTVIHCNCEDTADRSSDYLRDLWTDLKSS